MEEFVSGFLGSLFTLAMYYYFYSSPKAQIRRLHQENEESLLKIAEARKLNNGGALINIYESHIRKRNALINSILDYHFHREHDEDYISDNRA